MILTKEYLLKIERCSPLLPPPGPEVVEELLGHIRDTQHQFTVAIADREERIRMLEAQIASEHELPRPGEAGSLLAALDGETKVPAVLDTEWGGDNGPEPKKGVVDG